MPPRPKATSAQSRLQRPARNGTRSPLRQVRKEVEHAVGTRSPSGRPQKLLSAASAEAAQSRRSAGRALHQRGSSPQSHGHARIAAAGSSQSALVRQATPKASNLRNVRNAIETTSGVRHAGARVASRSESSERPGSRPKSLEGGNTRSRSGSPVRSRSQSTGSPARSGRDSTGSTSGKRPRSGSVGSPERREATLRSGSAVRGRSSPGKQSRSRSSSDSPHRKLGVHLQGSLGSSFTSTTGSEAIRRALTHPLYAESPQPRILRESPKVETVEKEVTLPQFRLEERIEEIPVVLYEDHVVIIPERQTVEVIRQVPKIDVQEQVKNVRMPLYEGRDTPVEVPTILHKEELVEVPVLHCVDLLKETAKPIVQRVPKHVDVNVNSFVEKLVEIPFITSKEVIVEIPKVESCPLKKEVVKAEVERVAKKIVKPEYQIAERTEEVSITEKVERVKEVPQIEYHTIVKEVPVYVTEVVEKRVPKTEIQIVERSVEIPSIQTVERIIEVPEVEIREVIRKVPRPVVHYVEKSIPKVQMSYANKIVEVPTSLIQEVPVEVPENMVVETIIKVPKPVVEFKDKEIPCVTYEVNDKVVEIPLTLREETLLEVDVTQIVDQVRQVAKPVYQFVDKVVPNLKTKCFEQLEEVPIPLQQEKAVFTPQVQRVERLREQAVLTTDNQVKSIPMFAMPYVGKCVEKDIATCSAGLWNSRLDQAPNLGAKAALQANQATNPPTSQPRPLATSAPGSPILGSRSQLIQYPQTLTSQQHAVASQPQSSRTATPRSPSPWAYRNVSGGDLETSMQRLSPTSPLRSSTAVPNPIGISSSGLAAQRAPSPLPLVPSSRMSPIQVRSNASRSGPSRSSSPIRLQVQSSAMVHSVGSPLQGHLRSGSLLNRYALQAVSA